jgi:hypothetical protein
VRQSDSSGPFSIPNRYLIYCPRFPLFQLVYLTLKSHFLPFLALCMGLDIDNENILHFDHLAFLSLTIENYVNDPDLHALRLLSGITTPGLETLHIRMIYRIVRHIKSARLFLSGASYSQMASPGGSTSGCITSNGVAVYKRLFRLTRSL